MLKNKAGKKERRTPECFEKTYRERMQIVTWPRGKAALNIIKRRQQKNTRRHDTGNVFSLLVSSGRSGMIECWWLPGPLQRGSSTPPTPLLTYTRTHTRTHTCTHAQPLSWHTLTHFSLPAFWVTKTSRHINCHLLGNSLPIFSVEGTFQGNTLLLWYVWACVCVCASPDYNRV